MPFRFSIAPIAFSSDSMLVAGVIDCRLSIFDLKTRTLKRRLRRIEHSMHAVAFSPDGKLVAASEAKDPPGQHPGTLRLWNVDTGKQVAEWVAHHRAIDSLCFSRDNKVLVSGGIGGVHLWNVGSQRRLTTLEEDARIVAFSPNGKLLAVGGWTNEVHFWDPTTHKRVRTIQAGTGWVRSFAFSPDGKNIVTGGSERALRLWDVETGRQILPFSGLESTAFSLQFTPDGKTLASYGDDLTVRLWDLDTKKEKRRLLTGSRGAICPGPGQALAARSLAFSPNGKTLATIGVPKQGDADNPVPLWIVTSGDKLAVIRTPRPKSAGYRPTAIAFSPDGDALATVNGGRLQLWSPESAAQLRLFPSVRRHPYLSVAFSPDGRRLAASQLDPPQIELWDWTSGRQIRAFPCQKAGATCITFSPNGQMLATTSCWFRENASQSDSTIQLREPATGTLVRTLEGHTGSPACIDFCPNGRLLASVGQHDRIVRVWDVLTGKELAQFTGHNGQGELILVYPFSVLP